MNFTDEIRHTIQRHMKASTNWDMPINEIAAMPYYEQIWAWWIALAYFGEKHWFERLEDAPEGLKWITVIGSDKYENYKWEDGKYVFVQKLTKAEVKDIYGK